MDHKLDIIETLIQSYNSFTKSEKKITDYILSHTTDAQYISISELASNSGVALSTITLFCRKLHLNGFNDFKLELAKAAAHAPSAQQTEKEASLFSSNSLTQVIEDQLRSNQSALTQTQLLLDVNAVETAVDILTNAGQVVCLGQGNHSAIATAAFSMFSTVSSKFKTIQDSHLQAIAVSTLSAGDAVLYFSYSGATHELLHMMEITKQNKIKVLLVTRFSQSPAATLADAVLLCGTNENPLQFGSVTAMTAQLYVIDVLFSGYCLKNKIVAEANREYTAKVLAHKMI